MSTLRQKSEFSGHNLMCLKVSADFRQESPFFGSKMSVFLAFYCIKKFAENSVSVLHIELSRSKP